MIPSRVGIVHVHSDYSHDGRDSLESLRDFALSKGIGFVGLTEHAEDLTRERFSAYVAHCEALSDDLVRLVPGLEFRFDGLRGFHLLALGLREWIEPLTPMAFVEMTAGRVEFTILAHPILMGYVGEGPLLMRLDAVEVWNARYNTRYLPDPRAIRLLRSIRRGLRRPLGVAGLDQHDRRNDRGLRIVLDTPNAIRPLHEMREGRFRNYGGLVRFAAEAQWGMFGLGLLTLLRWGFDRIERIQDRWARWAQSRSGE